jgi:RNA:NAD 2'-phosphotransferase (TPT1/KptA family)
VSHQRIPIIVHLNCVCLQEEGYKQWLESSNVYLDQDHVPFDVQVYETALGVYEITVLDHNHSEYYSSFPRFYAS